MPTTWTSPADIVAVWRPLKPAETQRAPGLIAFVERAIRREWPAVAARVDAGDAIADDVRDVVAWSVMPLLAPDVDLPPNAKSWQDTSGSESRSVTLDGSAAATVLTFAPWMVRVFEPDTDPVKSAGSALPRGGGFGPPGDLDGLFEGDLIRRWSRGTA